MTTDRSLSLQSPASMIMLGADDGDPHRLHSAQERGALRRLDRLTRELFVDIVWLEGVAVVADLRDRVGSVA